MSAWVTAPEWTQRARFVLNAKLQPGTTHEQFQEMMRDMLADRFKLKAHRETKEMQGYALTVAKGGPKLSPAAAEPPLDQPVPTEEVTLGKDGYPKLPEGWRQASIQNRTRIRYPTQTMEQFAHFISGQLGGPVADATGLKGKYDISLFWDTPTGADPDPGPTLTEAVQEQLGLKLVSKKQAVGIVVVDHSEKLPTPD